MIPTQQTPIRVLPIVPQAVLKRHNAYEKFDNRFKACARLLQALWRERQGLGIGAHVSRDGRKRKIGSLIANAEADTGRNFLSPYIARLARLEVAYQERGALIDRNRLFSNMLSSMPLAFNLAGPWRAEPELCAQVLRAVIPGADIAKVRHIWFEHSPGRLDPMFTNDRTAFDIAVVFERGDGKLGFVGIEVKYSESCQDAPPAEIQTAFNRLAEESGLYKDPMHAALRVNPLQQFFREHLLAYAAKASASFEEAHFVLIAPRHNHLVQRSAQLYSAFLSPEAAAVPFHIVELEQVIEAYAWAGERGHAEALYERYCDWWLVDGAVRTALDGDAHAWSILPAAHAPIALIGKAA